MKVQQLWEMHLSILVVGKWGFWDIDLGNFRELGQDFLYLF